MPRAPAPPDPGLSTVLTSLKLMLDQFLRALPHLIVALIVLALFWVGGAFIRKAIRRATARRAHANVGMVIGRIAHWALILVGALIAVSVVAPSVKPSDILSVLGVGTIAIGFAFKDILQNFVAGILILLREPFRVGDQIVFKTFEGTVEDIDTRSTRLRTYDGRRIVIPNGDVYTSAFVVNTAYDERRTEYEVGIGYGDDIALATDTILRAITAVDGVRADPAPDVLPMELAGSSVNLRVRWWTGVTQNEMFRVRGKVIEAMKRALNAAQVDLPYPTRVVLFHDQTDAYDGDRRRQREGWPPGDAPPPPDRIAQAVTGSRGPAPPASPPGGTSAPQ